MDKIIWIFFGAFCIVGICIILQALGVFDLKRKRVTTSAESAQAAHRLITHPCNEKDILAYRNHYIKILDNSMDISEQTEAIMQLLESGYFYVHVQQNEGNNYSDKIQSEKMNKLLTPSAIDKIKRMEGLNGEYSF